MTKPNNLDFLLLQPQKIENERKAARLEAFQEMARVLQNKQTENSSLVTDPIQNPNNKVRIKTASC